MKDRYLLTSEGLLCYRIKKDGNKTLLFLHGGGSSISAWFLTKKYWHKTNTSIVFLDLRGHGKSFKPKKLQDYRLEKHANDIFYLINKLRLKKIILIGHCLGSMVAATFTSLYPQRVEKLILINPGINRGLFFFNGFTYFLILLIYKIIKFLNINFSLSKKRVDYSKFKNTHDLSFKRLWADFKYMGVIPACSQILAFFEWDFIKIYKKITVPTLIIGSKKDSIFNLKVTNKIKNFIPKAKLKIIDTNHISIINKPKEVMNEILSFIKK